MPSLQTQVLCLALCAVISPVFPCTPGAVTQLIEYVTSAQLHLGEIQMLSAAFSFFFPQAQVLFLGPDEVLEAQGYLQNLL